MLQKKGSKLPYNDHDYLQTHVDEGAQTLLDQHPDLQLYMSQSQKHEQEAIEL
ncbi:hypothetical protein DPMN_058816 [Dreissena polymorpha]|uniref:Uncharacterized protein n=1 Tax=Dreissena polymorpha TaxID=45954 RepID=A0A9D4C2W3_DREPO|nr:hypothetical protein DPMN_058816 [Dreissena polymorpha]